ncbi:hypothetical protein B0J13DRAFT_490523 [Dactylonectria estremocensis]|uniref:Zn(2)-C6 fungal-type domain-containing protein n=1 Tax=Dactylonectria estremocensis TaxID=1079267 RepID=A0A9P9JE04_9HYPO|nr:hypothetical protein B0J13DRAFT_490523 [Dactylonectria estremocensis]
MAPAKGTPPSTSESAGSSAATAGPSRAEPAGRVRRQHRKSRRGCRPCKSSRIKCDEVQPACSNCIRKEISCDYFEAVRAPINESRQRMLIPPLRRDSPEDAPLLPARRKTREREEQEEQHATSKATTSSLYDYEASPPDLPTILAHCCSPPASITTPPDRLLELRLLSHYQEMIARSSKRQASWSIWTLDMAMKSPLVMDSLLGFTAFHLRRLGNRDWGVREASHKYMARAIRLHKEESGEGLREDNAAAMIASCAFILFHTSTNQQYLQSGAEPRLPLHWFRPWQSAKGFFGHVWPSLQTIQVGHNMGLQFGVLKQFSLQAGSGTFGFLLHDMEPDSLADEEILTAYRQAVWQLDCIYGHAQQARLLQFPALVTPRFVELLEAQDPRTLAIVGYFFMLVKRRSVLWWVDGAADREFAAVMEFLPKDWWPVMDWAVQMFEQNSDPVPVAPKWPSFNELSHTRDSLVYQTEGMFQPFRSLPVVSPTFDEEKYLD